MSAPKPKAIKPVVDKLTPVNRYTTLREANTVRQKEWDTGGDIDLSYAGNELAGEVGEAIELGIVVARTRQLVKGVDDELGDVVICCDLIAGRLNLPLEAVVGFGRGTETSFEKPFMEMAAASGRACNIIKKLERERHGMVGSRATPEDLRVELQQTVFWAYRTAGILGIDLGRVVATKFNATSVKYGLTTMMEV